MAVVHTVLVALTMILRPIYLSTSTLLVMIIVFFFLFPFRFSYYTSLYYLVEYWRPFLAPKYCFFYLTMQCPFDENQFGFRKHCSTVQLLTKVTKDWLHARDGGLSAGLACINLRKAFDAVRHQILLESLSSAGIGGIPLNWFASYLSERTQRVVTQRGCSSTLVVSSGVPQGTVLGPVLFNLYVRELPKTAEAHGLHLPMFADDMTLYTSHKSLHLAAQTLNLALSSLSAAVLDLGLMVNVDKPVVLFLSHPQFQTRLHLSP